MFRKLFSATALVSVVVAGLSLSTRTQACPVALPETLLSLYKSSKEIHLATFSRSIDVAIQSEEDGYSRVAVKKYFDISSTWKGENRKSFEVNEIEYRYKPPVNVEASEEAKVVEDTEDGAESGEIEQEEETEKAMTAGDTVILFLAERASEDDEEDQGDRKDKDDEGQPEMELRLVNLRDGVRRIDPRDSDVFESRIKELNSIYSGGEKERDEQLAEWVIRTMEHQATRWDGARELDMSFDSLDRLAAAAEYEEKQKGKSEKVDGDEEEKPWVDESDEESAGIARVLSQTQKDRISYILMTPDDAKPTATLRDGDSMLLNVVQRWGGPDVAEFLLQRLGNPRMEPYEVSSLMSSISAMLKDDELAKAAEAYREVAWDDPDEVYEEESADEAEPVSEELPTAEATPEVKVNAGPEAKPRRTVLEVRTERLANFIALARSVVSRPEAEVDVAVRKNVVRSIR